MIVLDASIAFEIAVATTEGSVLRDRIRLAGEPLTAPEIIELEFLQTLRRYVRSGEIDRARASGALRTFADMEIERFAHAPLRARIWDLRDNLAACDAAYFALAEMLDSPLWTRDSKYMSVPGHSARIEVL